MQSIMENMTAEKLNDYLYERYANSERSTWENQAIQDRDFVKGKQWLTKDANAVIAANQMPISDNELRPSRDLLLSMLTENAPRWNCTGRENSDTNTAAAIADLFSYIWYISKGNRRVKMSTGDYVDIGLGLLMAYVDPEADMGKPEIFMRDLEPLDVYIDPNTTEEDSTNAANILYAPLLTSENIKLDYPDFDFEGAHPDYSVKRSESDRYAGEGQISVVSDDTHTRYRIIDRYTKIRVKRWKVKIQNAEQILTEQELNVYLQRPAMIESRIGQPDKYFIGEEKFMEMVQVFKISPSGIFHYMINENQEIEIMPGAEHEGMGVIPGSTTKYTKSTIGDLYQERLVDIEEVYIKRVQRVITIGGKLYQDIIMPISEYPIVSIMNHFSRNPFPEGDIRVVKPIQELLNKIDSKIVDYLQKITNLKAFLPEGTPKIDEIRKTLHKSGTDVYTYDPEFGVPIFPQFPPLPNGIFELRESLILRIQRILGSYSFQDGNTQQAPETKGGTLLLDEMGLRRSKSKRSDIEAGLNQLAKVILEMIPKVYDIEKINRIIKANHRTAVQSEYDVEEILNDLKAGKFDAVVESGSMLPTNRQARSEYFVALFDKGILRDRSVILRESEVPDVEEVIKKEDDLIRAEQMIQQMEETIKDLEGQIQTQTREAINANKRTEVEKFKSVLKGEEHKARTSVTLAQMRLNDEVQKQKEDTRKRTLQKEKK